MDKILCTGGTGFVGSWMYKTEPPALRVVYLSRAEYDLRRWRLHTWDAIIHLANIAPTEVLEHAQRFGSRVLYASSGIFYHTENDNEYRQNKIAWEKECRDSGVDVVIARLFTFSGEGLDDGKAIVQFERAARAGRPLVIWGDGSCVRSYMHGAEMGRWLWAILQHGVKGEAYDVGSNTPVTMTELAQQFSSDIIYERDRYVPMPVYLPVDTAKTEALLSLQNNQP